MSNSFAQTLVRFALRTLIGLVLTVVVLAGLYLLFAYHLTYSRGESVRALATMPAIPEKFAFTVRDTAVADQINSHIGQKVVMEYEQHKGLPECMGETQYFVVAVRLAPGE